MISPSHGSLAFCCRYFNGFDDFKVVCKPYIWLNAWASTWSLWFLLCRVWLQFATALIFSQAEP